MPPDPSSVAPSLKSLRTTVQRRPTRGIYDFEPVARILDEAFICHVGFSVREQPYVIPTGYGRSGRMLYLHGSAASRMLRSLEGGIPVCVTVTLLDGIVLARSAFNHSMNYRSVVILGNATLVEGEEKDLALRVISDHLVPGRWDEARGPTVKELLATSVLRVAIDEASAKVRSGPPLDDDEDLGHPCWAGVLPFALTAGAPMPDPRGAQDVAVPPYLANYHRPA